MSCSCKDNERDIELCKSEILQLREMFIYRMMVDSETKDKRRKDFNQAIFEYSDSACIFPNDIVAKVDKITMDMILACFDNAVKDWRRSWCDVDNCRRE